MKTRVFAAAAVLVLTFAAPSRASLTPSEAEQVRRGVVTTSDLGRVRSLVARPDLSTDEAADAVVRALTTSVLDPAHISFLRDLVFGDGSAAPRPLLAVVAVRGVLARADAVIDQHGLDLDHVPTAWVELELAYGFVEEIASAGDGMNVPPSSRASCASALKDHIARHPTVLLPQAAVALPVARARAQAAIGLLDLMPDAPTRRIDAADGLALSGARRGLLVERGVLVLDAGSPDAQLATFRSVFDRFPGLRVGIEAVVIGAPAPGLEARDGAVIATGDDFGPTEPARLWGADIRSPPGDPWITAVARGLANAVTERALDLKPDLRAQVDRDGGMPVVAAMVARLTVSGPLAVDVAATRLLASHPEGAAHLADAVGALAAFSPPPSRYGDGLVVSVGSARTAAVATQLTHIVLGAAGAARAFRLDGRTWLFERDASGAVTGLRRDGIPVTVAMLPAGKT